MLSLHFPLQPDEVLIESHDGFHSHRLHQNVLDTPMFTYYLIYIFCFYT